MEYLLWFAWGFVCTSIGLVLGNWRANRNMNLFIQKTMEMTREDLKRQLIEIRKQNKKASDKIKKNA